MLGLPNRDVVWTSALVRTWWLFRLLGPITKLTGSPCKCIRFPVSGSILKDSSADPTSWPLNPDTEGVFLTWWEAHSSHGDALSHCCGLKTRLGILCPVTDLTWTFLHLGFCKQIQERSYLLSHCHDPWDLSPRPGLFLCQAALLGEVDPVHAGV